MMFFDSMVTAAAKDGLAFSLGASPAGGAHGDMGWSSGTYVLKDKTGRAVDARKYLLSPKGKTANGSTFATRGIPTVHRARRHPPHHRRSSAGKHRPFVPVQDPPLSDETAMRMRIKALCGAYRHS